MNMTKRVMAALMAALVIMVTTYNAYTISADAMEVVVGGTLGELLTFFLISLGVTYVGYECIDNLSGSSLESELQLYLNTTEGSSALKDYAKTIPEFTVIDGGGGSDPEPPEDPNEIIDTKVAGLVLSQQLYDFAEGFFEYITDPNNNSTMGAAINEASNQDVFFVNAILPEGVYIGFNNEITPNVTTLEGYDQSLAHIQYYRSDINSYVVSQTENVSYPFYNEFLYNTEILSTFRGDNNNFTVNNGSMLYRINSDGIFQDLRSNSNECLSYEFRGAESVLYNHGKTDGSISSVEYPLYLSPTEEQPILYYDHHNDYVHYAYFVYVSGAVSDGETLTAPSGVITAEEALTSAKAIVNKDFMEYLRTINKSLAESYPEEVPVLSPEAINEIYNNVSNYYDQAVTNYYSNPSYVTENEYITNITNIYEQAIADNPAVDNPVVDPAIPISPTLGAIGDYKVIGLSDVFPFCIPFDMYDLMTILVAEPKAISFDYTFYFGEYLGEYTLTVNLSIFDPVAKVVRTMELLLYMYGLMLATRNLIRG